MNERTIGLSHARVAIGCNACFDASSITRAGISLPQPITVGRRYRKGGIAVVSINPGASMDGGYKQARKRALDRFAAGDDTALLEYWNSLASDATNFWNPNYLARIRRLGLHIDSLVVGNIALCATESNRYPTYHRGANGCRRPNGAIRG